MSNRKIERNTTFQVVIDVGWRKTLMQLRAESGRTIRALVEGALSESYGVGSDGKPYELKK